MTGYNWDRGRRPFKRPFGALQLVCEDGVPVPNRPNGSPAIVEDLRSVLRPQARSATLIPALL